MKVVSNAGPLMALGKLGRLDLLQKLYGTVLVPQQVYEETVDSGIALGAPDALLIRDYFTREILLSRPTPVAGFHDSEIEDGERATIELAITQGADLVLIDDAAARTAAERSGLDVRGTLGVILEAEDRGALTTDEAILLLEQTKRRRDIWIRDSLCDLALERLRT